MIYVVEIAAGEPPACWVAKSSADFCEIVKSCDCDPNNPPIVKMSAYEALLKVGTRNKETLKEMGHTELITCLEEDTLNTDVYLLNNTRYTKKEPNQIKTYFEILKEKTDELLVFIGEEKAIKAVKNNDMWAGKEIARKKLLDKIEEKKTNAEVSKYELG